MRKFALANYTDQEIFDILDSYNLSNLKKVKMSILRKIIRQLPDLIELRGSDLIVEKLLDIVTDESVTIKRYYLTKIYNTNAEGRTIFDTTKTYDENVNVIFKEKIIRNGKLVIYSLDDDHVKKILDVGVDHVSERRGEYGKE